MYALFNQHDLCMYFACIIMLHNNTPVFVGDITGEGGTAICDVFYIGDEQSKKVQIKELTPFFPKAGWVVDLESKRAVFEQPSSQRSYKKSFPCSGRCRDTILRSINNMINGSYFSLRDALSLDKQMRDVPFGSLRRFSLKFHSSYLYPLVLHNNIVIGFVKESTVYIDSSSSEILLKRLTSEVGDYDVRVITNTDVANLK